MKTTIAFFVLFCLGFLANSQTINYGYDAAGNRISRTIDLSTKNYTVSEDTTGLDNEAAKGEEQFSEVLGDYSLTIYPNPTKGLLKINITGIEPGASSKINLYDLSGKLVYQNNQGTGTDIIDISEQPSGTYILKVNIGSQKTEWKIMKH
ncbi:MAG: hypothetical protein Kow0068_01500 [Marinilabiliales bacterium]